MGRQSASTENGAAGRRLCIGRSAATALAKSCLGKCFEQPLRLQAEVTLPRAYIHRTSMPIKKPFAQFASRANGEAGWHAYELDASHSPNVTAPTALMEVLKQFLPA
jgi:hypothetical protein